MEEQGGGGDDHFFKPMTDDDLKVSRGELIHVKSDLNIADVLCSCRTQDDTHGPDIDDTHDSDNEDSNNSGDENGYDLAMRMHRRWLSDALVCSHSEIDNEIAWGYANVASVQRGIQDLKAKVGFVPFAVQLLNQKRAGCLPSPPVTTTLQGMPPDNQVFRTDHDLDSMNDWNTVDSDSVGCDKQVRKIASVVPLRPPGDPAFTHPLLDVYLPWNLDVLPRCTGSLLPKRWALWFERW